MGKSASKRNQWQENRDLLADVDRRAANSGGSPDGLILENVLNFLIAYTGGMSLEVAAASIGVSAHTIMSWRRRCPAFEDACVKAFATKMRGMQHLPIQIMWDRLEKGDWGAAQFYMKNCMPKVIMGEDTLSEVQSMEGLAAAIRAGLGEDSNADK